MTSVTVQDHNTGSVRLSGKIGTESGHRFGALWGQAHPSPLLLFPSSFSTFLLLSWSTFPLISELKSETVSVFRPSLDYR